MPTNTRLVTLADPRSPMAEAYRALRTNLMFSSLERPLSTLLVTSPASGEGKSLTLANLAVTLAQSGRSTLVVDCDLRRPCQHELFGLPLQPGLSEALAAADGQLALVPTGIENLALLPAGQPVASPADMLGSRRMEALIAQLKEQAEVVLFDAPPVMVVTDAALLASKLDGVLLVLSAGHTRRDHAEQAKALLEKINVRVVGTVLTNAAADRSMAAY